MTRNVKLEGPLKYQGFEVVNLAHRQKQLLAERVVLSELNTDLTDEMLANSLLVYMGVVEADEVAYKTALVKLKVGEPLTEEDCDRLGIPRKESKKHQLEGLVYTTVEPVQESKQDSTK